MLIDINKIIVNDRIRKDYGDLEELAEDIRENTLLNALVVSPNGNGTYTLIAGERRLRAMRDILGYTQVIVNTVGARDDEHALLMEISENECRKEFTKTERLDYARRLARIEAAKAKERMLAGKAQDPTQKIAEGTGETREKVAEALGTNRETIRQEQFIEDHRDMLDPADFAEWDEGKLSTNKAFQRIKAAQRQAEQEREEAEKERDAARHAEHMMHREVESMRQALAERPEPEVIEREVVREVESPESKRRIAELERENKRLNDEYQQMWKKKRDADQRLQQANELLGENDRNNNARRDIEQLTIATNSYLRNYGGKAWAFDQFDRVDEPTQQEFIKAITNLTAFAQNLTAMIQDRKQLGA